MVLNKLNGDKCQTPDINNGCTPKMSDEGGVEWSQCKAYNCTMEITTTTSTTHSSPAASTAASTKSNYFKFLGFFL